MKERPILFSAPMVRALLDGSKTQTRRILKSNCQEIGERDDGSLWPWSEHPDTAADHWHACPYGQPGDRLWVRETHFVNDLRDPMQLPADARSGLEILYRATDEKWLMNMEDTEGLRWSPSIHMPRWASRITLEITGVRVERLQDISYEDALAEGIPHLAELVEHDKSYDETPEETSRRLRWPQRGYQNLWNDLNGVGSWDANPWVWVIEFRRLTA